MKQYQNYLQTHHNHHPYHHHLYQYHHPYQIKIKMIFESKSNIQVIKIIFIQIPWAKLNVYLKSVYDKIIEKDRQIKDREYNSYINTNGSSIQYITKWWSNLTPELVAFIKSRYDKSQKVEPQSRPGPLILYQVHIK